MRFDSQTFHIHNKDSLHAPLPCVSSNHFHCQMFPHIASLYPLQEWTPSDASSISQRTSWLVQMLMRKLERVGEEDGEMVKWM